MLFFKMVSRNFHHDSLFHAGISSTTVLVAMNIVALQHLVGTTPGTDALGVLLTKLDRRRTIMTHEQFVAQIDRFFASRLDIVEMAEYRRHVVQCTTCATAQSRRFRELLKCAPVRPPVPTPCLSNETLRRLVADELTPESYTLAAQHIDDCISCCNRVGAILEEPSGSAVSDEQNSSPC